MFSLSKKIILSMAVAATTLAAIPAEAGDRWRDGRRHHRSIDGDELAAGVAGLALGALIVGAMTSQRNEPVYDNPYRHPRPRPNRDYVIDDSRPVVINDYEPNYEPTFEPWSRAWLRYCKNRYRSFDPQSGTYVGYDGRERFCVAN